MPSQEYLGARYDESYFLGFTEKWEGRVYEVEGYVHQEPKSHGTFNRYMDRIGTYLNERRILDVGAGVGTFLAVAKERGWETVGVEISEFAARYAREHFGVEVLQGTVSAVNLPDEGFDAVTMWDCIEHLRDPREELAHAWRLLRPGGFLFAATMNMDSFDAKLLRENWTDIIRPPFHTYYFSVRTLRELLERAQFEVAEVYTAGYFDKLPILRDLPYILNKYLPPFQGRMDHLPWGSSVFAVARKARTEAAPPTR